MSRLVTAGLALSIVFLCGAAPKKSKNEMQAAHMMDYSQLDAPDFATSPLTEDFFKKQLKSWVEGKRKVAGNFSDSDLSKDFREKFRPQFLKVTNAKQLEALLKETDTQYANYSPDVQYFLSQLHLLIPLRGIIWKLRPLFERGTGFFGNKSTHVMAVQLVRTAVIGINTYLPSKQWEAGIEFLTEPSESMTAAEQFRSVAQFQAFVNTTLVKTSLDKAATRIANLVSAHPSSVFVWDNLLNFGTGTFVDGANRYIGHGPAEMYLTLAGIYKAQHEALVFCAYNQDYILDFWGLTGAHLGIESTGLGSAAATDLGLSSEDIVGILKPAIQNKKFLELRDYNGTKYGTNTMKAAFVALGNFAESAGRAYDLLQGKNPSPAMGLNPVYFQPNSANMLPIGISNLRAVVKGPAKVRDSISGEEVEIDVPAFYNSPPKNMLALIPQSFDHKNPAQKDIISTADQSKMSVRNYLHGRAIGWNNAAWSQFVPSAQGKDAKYMLKAKRIIHYSLGTSLAFGLTDVFVR